jgi:UDP-N-acetylglucosamine--N-acetylmuramyl-(pentapeptide) pyrophosphoryl-undecaprenol N-acetylglucosamine transferase
MIRPVGDPTVLFAGGGTGGHLFPGVAVAERLRQRAPGARVLLAATDRDARAPHGAACSLDLVRVSSPRRPRNPLGLPVFGARMAAALGRSLALLRAQRPHVVVGLGGYGSVAPVLAARMVGTPVVLMEQNAVPGVATRMLSRFGTVTAASFPGLEFRGVRGAVIVTGNPIRREVLRPRTAHGELGLEPDLPVLAVLGGSLGARGLNDRVLHALPRLVEATGGLCARGGVAPFQVIHGVGRRDEIERMQVAYRDAGVVATVRPFFRDMAAVYGTASAALCRAGGTTVAELAALGLPSVLVPYPHHADQHQKENARALLECGAATLADEAELTPARLAAELAPLLRDEALRARRAREALRAGRPRAAERVADLIVELADTSGRATR